MKAAVYLRQSLDRHGDELAIGRQREDCLKLCSHRGWQPVEYADNDKSATSGRRPAYEQMLADIETGLIEAVVTWDLDRLHRQPVELEHFINLADAKHIPLASVGGDADLSTDSGRLFARIKGAVARAEVERKSARQKRAARQRAEAGISCGPRAFGYSSSGILIHEEAALLREAYSAVLAGQSLYSVAIQWNNAGARTTMGNMWSGKTVRQSLLRPRYAGLRAYLDEIIGPADWPAVVCEDVWHAVHTMLTDPGRRRRPTGRKYLLTGLARCGNCGATVVAGVKRQSGYTVYICKRCLRISRKQIEVDNWVVWHTLQALSQLDAWQVLTVPDREGRAHSREQAEALRARLDQLAIYFADGLLTASQVQTASQRIMSTLTVLESEIFDANRQRIFAGLTDCDDLRTTFHALSLERKRAVIDTMFTVTIMPIGHGGPKTFDPSKVKVKRRPEFSAKTDPTQTQRTPSV